MFDALLLIPVVAAADVEEAVCVSPRIEDMAEVYVVFCQN